MKKKILSIIFAICLILPCAFIFSACDNNPTEPIMHTVTFVYNNGTENSTIQVEEGKYIEQPNNPSKEGYIFDGWYVDDFKWSFELVAVMNDVTLTAKWTEIPATTYFAVTFNADNGTDNETIQIVSGNKVTCPETNPTKYGYTFDGWYFGEYKWNFGYNTVTEALTLKAHWIANEYSITYELDGGINNPDNLPLYTVETNLTFAEPTKAGYKFMGWFLDDEFTTAITSTEGYSTNLTLYANWSRINTITYELNGGTNNTDNPTTFFEHEEVVLKDPTKDDEYKVFTGWFLDNHYEEKIETIPTGTVQDIKLWAKWEDIFKVDNKGEQHEKITGLTAVGKTLKKLAIPRNVKEIGNLAFADSNILEEVVFNGNDKVILDYGAFQNCSKLTSIILPSGTTYIMDNSFQNCISLTAITIPSSVWKICSFSFSGCTNLETVIFETNSELEEIMDNVFKSCAKLKNITLPSSLNTIKSSAFEGCRALEAISIPQNVESIGDYAFADCSSLKSVTFAENCKLAGISRSTFAGCSALETITIPSSVQNIGEYAFNGCGKLASVVFEEGSFLVNINQNAFNGCSALETITIPKSVTKIEEMAFKGCADLASITFEQDSTLTYIGINAFSGCSDLTSIIIPNSVTKIDNNAFNGCYELETITFETGSALTYIGSKTFSGCSSLTTIIIPSSVEMIGNYLFDEFNYNIKSIVFDDISTWYVTTSESDWTSKTNGTEIDVSNSTDNEEYVKNSYYLYKS